MRNVFEAILECGHDEDSVPVVNGGFNATDAPAGLDGKVRRVCESGFAGRAVMASRRQVGLQRPDRRSPSAQ